MSPALPALPRGSWIRVGYDEHGQTRLSWRMPFGEQVVVNGLFLGAAALLVYLSSRFLGPGDATFIALFLGCMKVALTLASLKAERLTLGESVLLFDRDYGITRGRNVWEVPRAELGAVRLERLKPSGELARQRLTIDHGPDRLEIGDTLPDTSREWLFGVLRAWAGEGPRPAAGARPAPPLRLSIAVAYDGDGVLRLHWEPASRMLPLARRLCVLGLYAELVG
jgi:hypothetical protein